MKIKLASVFLTLGVALSGGALVACGGSDTQRVEAYEDCDVEDQRNHEPDCGYRDRSTGIWFWYTWVVLNQRSYPPAGWRPPVGVPAPPKRTITIPKNKSRNCAMAGLKPGPAAPAPKPPPAPPANKAPAAPKNNNNNAPKNNAPANNVPAVKAPKIGC